MLLSSLASRGTRTGQGKRIISTYVASRRQQGGCWLDVQGLTSSVPRALYNPGPASVASCAPCKPQTAPPPQLPGRGVPFGLLMAEMSDSSHGTFSDSTVGFVGVGFRLLS